LDNTEESWNGIRIASTIMLGRYFGQSVFITFVDFGREQEQVNRDGVFIGSRIYRS
jgi:hypothetical protein